MAGYGQQAVSYLAGEELRNTPCTPGGCYDRLKDVGGKILLVGVTHARNTYMVLTVRGLVQIWQNESCDRARPAARGPAAPLSPTALLPTLRI